MDPRHLTKRQPRASAYDWRGHLKPWARAVTEELTRLWCPSHTVFNNSLGKLRSFEVIRVKTDTRGVKA